MSRPGQGFGSIFQFCLLLAVGSAGALALASIVVVLYIPPPFSVPSSTFEVARVVEGASLSPRAERLERTSTRGPGAVTGATRSGAATEAIRAALALQLNRPLADVQISIGESRVFGSLPPSEAPRKSYEEAVLNDATAYADDIRFSPLIFGPFVVSVRMADGGWITVTRSAPPGPHVPPWTIGMILLALVGLFPLVWLASSRLARPIRAFAAAADRIGTGNFEEVKVSGPREIRVAAAALNDMQARLKQHLSERIRLVGAIAHDLRTPLSRMVFQLASAPPEVRQRIEVDVKEMDRMIRVSLDFAQSDGAEIRRETLDLQLLVEGVVDNFADAGQDAEIAPGPPLLVSGDPTLLTRLFSNLVDNALTYGSRADVRLSSEPGWAVVDIADTGPGMSEGELARAFEPYFRSETSRNRSTGGVGLGLAIVRSVAEAHEGTVALFNRPTGGLLARVRLPMRV